ncbi:hypothetical protein [Bacillus sp. 165]|nr:hypothetical protein [Bacillus sp. 165]MBO9131497.1 hypothetical protein [Bacillus sp. 165]
MRRLTTYEKFSLEQKAKIEQKKTEQANKVITRLYQQHLVANVFQAKKTK